MGRKHRRYWAGPAAVAMALGACSSSTGPAIACGPPDVAIGSSACLVFDDGNRLASHHAAIERVVRASVPEITDHMPLDDVTIRVVPGPRFVIPEIGIGGRAPGPGEVEIAVDANDPIVVTTLETELPRLLAHEMHHVRRIRSVGYGRTLFEAMITEGLADHFSVEVFGGAPPIWSTAVTGSSLEQWRSRASEDWHNPAYDHAKWFFGTSGDVPRWAGYSIGFDLVSDFLAADAIRTAAGLVDSPAASFDPGS